MLTITTLETELYDAMANEFIYIRPATITLEHSLLSISKWESRWHKPFLTDEKRSTEEVLDYIKCMTVNKNIDDSVYNFISDSEFQRVNNYVSNPMTATTFMDEPSKGAKDVITSELIYYWMLAHNIPFECDRWHLNRLLTLIRVCNLKNAPEKKRSASEIMASNKALNEQRRKMMETEG